MILDFVIMNNQITAAKIDLKNKIAVVEYIPNIDIDIDEFFKYVKLSVQTKGFKMNVEYKNIRIKIFCLGKLYNNYKEKFLFENKNILQCFKRKYCTMITYEKLPSSQKD